MSKPKFYVHFHTNLIKSMDKQQSHILKQRREKAQTLADAGVNLFSNDFKAPQPIAEILPRGEALAPESHEKDGGLYRVAGRIGGMVSSPVKHMPELVSKNIVCTIIKNIIG